MSVAKAVTVQLEPEQYERLAAEARRLGISPAALARTYVHAGLAGNGKTAAGQRQRAGIEALERLGALRTRLRQAGYPSIDAVQLVREGREELEQRSAQ